MRSDCQCRLVVTLMSCYDSTAVFGTYHRTYYTVSPDWDIAEVETNWRWDEWCSE